MESLANRIIKSYKLQELVGGGRFGEVYRAYQPAVGREVAIKVILPQYANQPDFVRRFEVETQTIARLEHPHIVPLYDYWRDPDGAYLVMRWLRSSLRLSIEHGAWGLEATARLLDQLAAALTVAHREGIVHRDIKPENILLDEDNNAYLADFSIAKDIHLRSSPSSLPFESDGAYTPEYLSPEQIQNGEASPRSDLYTLGYVLYEVLTSAKPFPDAKTPRDYLQKHLTTPLPQMSNTHSNIPAAIDEILQTATAKEPSYRYPTAQRLAAAFRAALPTRTARIPAQPLTDPLTEREYDVLRLMCDGFSNSEIASQLFLTRGTVKWYVQQVYGKLDVHSRQQAIDRASRLQLFESKGAQIQPESVVVADPIAQTAEPENPYKGLRAFLEADADDFFGRAALTERLLSRLSEPGEEAQFLALVGPSGSGKSSVVRAGLIPALRSGALATSPHPFIADLMPGAHPLEELEAALLRVAIHPIPGLLEQLREDRRGLVRAAKRLLPTDTGTELILVIDQFEELFTLTTNETVRTLFIDNLLSAVTDPRGRVRIILTLRADFYDRPLSYPRLAELVRAHTEVIVPLTARELEQAIVAPAERGGVRLETGLVATILKEVGEQPGTLPLLQYTLTELFERREGVTLTLDAYKALGGVLGALTRRADDIYERLDPTAQELVQQLFLRLISLGEGTEDTRRRTTRAELLAVAADSDAMDEIIDAYTTYRLLSLDIDPSTRNPTVEVAHEAILREWKCLRDWLSNSREDIRLQRQLAAMATEWRDAEQDDSFLIRGARLEQLERFAHDTRLALTEIENSYLKVSLAERERQAAHERERLEHEARLERRAINILRALVGVFAVATVLAVGLTLFAFNERNNAQSNFTRAERIRLAAQAQNALNQGEGVRVPALLALRSLELGYSPEADAALLTALSRNASRQIYAGHTGGITSGVFSPNGQYVLTAADDATARLWDTRTGAELQQFLGHSGLVNQAIFSPDGAYVLTGGTDGTVRQWDATTGEEARLLLEQGSPVTALTFSPNGRYIVTSDDSGIAQLWDFETMTLLRQFVGHTDTVAHAAFSSDGRHLATGSFDRTARLWDIALGDEMRRLEGHAGCVCYVSFSPDGSLLATASFDTTARLWDVATGQQLRRFIGHESPIVSAEFSPDSRFLVTAGRSDLTIRLWDVATGQQLRQLLGHTAEVGHAVFSPDGRFVLSSSTDNTTRLWELNIESEPRVFQNPLAQVHANSVVMAALSGDYRHVITANGAGIIQFWDVDTGQGVQELATENRGFISDAALSPNQEFVLTPGGDGIARLWDIASGAEIREYDGHTAPIITVEFSSDGEWMLTGAEDGSTILWEVDSGKARQHFAGSGDRVNSVAISPDRRMVATACDDAVVHLWHAERGVEVRQFAGHRGAVLSVTFSPDGRFMLTGGEDNTARLWDIQTGQELQRFDGHILPVSVAVFSPDGSRVITGSLDQTVRIWETESGQTIRHFVGHQSSLRSVTMSSDDQLLLTGDNSAAYLWHVNLQDIIELACDRLSEDFSPDERVRYNISDNRRVCVEPNVGGNAEARVWTPVPTLPVPIWTSLPPLND